MYIIDKVAKKLKRNKRKEIYIIKSNPRELDRDEIYEILTECM